MSICADAKEDLSPALLPPSNAQLASKGAAADLLPQPAARAIRGQGGMWPIVWQRIEALEEWVRMQLAQQQRQLELKVEKTFHDLQERLLALEGDRPKLELSMAQMAGSVKAIVEQLTSDAEHHQAFEMRQREWRRALEEHVRTELSGAEHVREARLQEFHKQLAEFQNKLRGRHSLEDAMRTELASATMAELENGAPEPGQSTEPNTRALLMAAAGSEVSERLDSLEWKLQNCASNARAAAASHHETLKWQAAKLSELQDHVRCLGDNHEQTLSLVAQPEASKLDGVVDEIHRGVFNLASRVASCEQVLSTEHELPKLRKEVADVSARLTTFEQALQVASDEEEEAEGSKMLAIQAGNHRGLDDIGETFSVHESEITSSQASPRN